MRTIYLSQGKYAIVDDCDFARVSMFKWCAYKDNRGNWYARRTDYSNGKHNRTNIALHRFIMGLYDASIQVDHADHNGLNNRRENIRVATNAQNQANRRKQKRPASSKFKGVSFYKSCGKWAARIHVNKSNVWLGLFQSERAAIKARKTAALKFYGEFACAK